jgi:peptidoglycan/xylan/chitin deacetylase (PgdA/CDA1 family)
MVAALAVFSATATAGVSHQPPKQASVAKGSPAAQLAFAKYAQIGTPIFCGGGNAPYVAFTFDDGPGPLTPALLRVLRANHVPGLFFDIGRNAAVAPAVVRAEMKLGQIGDHTWDHPILPSLDPASVDQELRSTRDLLSQTIGHPIRFFRPPFGQSSPDIEGIARGLGLLDIKWSVGADDSGPDQVYSTLVSRVQAGSIILLHENEPGEIEALQQFLPVLKQRGLTAVSVPQLLALDPPAADMPNNQGQCLAHWPSTG